MKQLLLLACLLGAVNIHAQDNAAARIILEQGKQMEEQVTEFSTSISRKKDHTLYISPDWQNSAVVGEDGQVTYFNGRFSVLDRAIMLKNKNGFRSISPARVKAAMVGDKYFVVVPADQLKVNTGTAFYELLSLGKVNLYKLYVLKTRMSGSNGITTALNGEKVYYIGEQFYYQPEGGLCQELKLNTKKILTLFGDRTLEVEAFAKEHNLKFKDQEDLVKVFDYFNALE